MYLYIIVYFSFARVCQNLHVNVNNADQTRLINLIQIQNAYSSAGNYPLLSSFVCHLQRS